MLSVSLTTCPNPACRKYQLQAWLYDARPGAYGLEKKGDNAKPTQHWALVPDSSASIFPDFVPQQIRDDYTEACRIVSLSPKAAATLARRCLQGMIRDVWNVKKKNLAAAIDALKKKVEPDVWKAIDGVRTLGNIGAHMERDVNLIVGVDPKEAEILLRLIEALVEDWYVKPRERKALYATVSNVAQAKVLARKPPAATIAQPVPADPQATTTTTPNSQTGS